MNEWCKQEQKLEISDDEGQVTYRNIHFVPWLNYSPRLLDEVPDDQWGQLYASIFNVVHYGYVSVSNKWSKDILRGKEPDVENPGDIATLMYPQPVTRLLDADPILTNLIMRKNSTSTLRTADDFQRVKTTLVQAVRLLGNNPQRMNADALKVQKVFADKMRPELGPELMTDAKERFGFLPKTRFIHVWASGTAVLTITKVGNEYRIVEAIVGTPD